MRFGLFLPQPAADAGMREPRLNGLPGDIVIGEILPEIDILENIRQNGFHNPPIIHDTNRSVNTRTSCFYRTLSVACCSPACF
jgi:hypothetical protein